ncbi:MAG: cytochrome c biogenesis protein CcsA [Planctomycetaceae bacterium]
MSSPSIPRNTDVLSSLPNDDAREFSLAQWLAYCLSPLASLKLTVTFFALAIFLIFAGTLAQVDKDIWEVVDQYFRSAIVKIPLQIFFPQSFFPSKPLVPGAIWFPGGWLIGAVLAVNLLSAHLIRFKVQATGTRRLLGAGIIAVGALATWMVIESGSNPDGIQHEPIFAWNTLRTIMQFLIVGLWAGAVYLQIQLIPHTKQMRWFRWWRGTVTIAMFGIFLAWTFAQGETIQLGDSSMRILWQLIKATVAGLILLAGCGVLFRKRAGVVLLHGGIALMMISEVLVGVSAKEAQMTLNEGETLNYVRDIRTVELAFVNTSKAGVDVMTVIPKSRLKEGVRISDDQLPCDVEIVRFMQNSNLRKVKKGETNPATNGAGIEWLAEPAEASTGTDMGAGVDMTAAYVRFFEKGTDKTLGTYLVGILQSEVGEPETLTVGEKKFGVSLRFARDYKPYSVKLIDVRKEDYLGTTTPRDYSSDIHLTDPTRSVDQQVHIWMNNPLRFAGETFYQSGYQKDGGTGVESTTLSVVTNTGWMIPYVSCMIVAVGLLAHFSIILLRFLDRRRREEVVGSATIEEASDEESVSKNSAGRKRDRREKHSEAPMQHHPQTGWLEKLVPLAVVLVFGGWLLSHARMPKYPAEDYQLYAFGQLPIVSGGRLQPIDSLARNSLRAISDRQTYRDANGKKQPAIRWFLDVVTQSDSAEKYKIFRIDHPEVESFFEVERDKNHRYSLAELRKKSSDFHRKVEEIQKKSAKTLSVLERRFVELDERIRTYTMLVAAFSPPPIPELPTDEDFQKDPTEARQRFMAIGEALMQFSKQLSGMSPPLAVPVGKEEPAEGKSSTSDKEVWEPYSIAWSKGFLQSQLMGQPPAEQTLHWNKMLAAYGKADVKAFNTAVGEYKAFLKTDAPVSIDQKKVDFETHFNQAEPFYHASVLYVVVFILAALAWLGWNRPLNRAAFWLTVFTFAIHTAALIARIYISGRPPVTNLYSSAVFIGWGAVVFGMIFEVVFKMGVGNILAGVAGFATLVIAHLLAVDGDTFVVLQAVLDTQFWLATHVVCITLGYATTFVAGILGIVYIVKGVATKSLTTETGKDLTRMIYGTLCFAIFFSFVGTVLGGLWDDDSWGRFWGWDPKENGALIIVLWNALVLHARWGAMVKDRGLAVLAVAGNIATSWSWFGVNELGVGLHSYGFTDGVLLALLVFIGSQLLIIAAGSLPKSMWMSRQSVG